jgi:glycosyltransferase involved in cell wall biosynthesis
MEESILRIATGLAEDGFAVFIYTRRQPAAYRRDEPEHPLISVQHLGGDKELLLAPFPKGAAASAGEETRADYLFLRNAIERRVREQPDRRHVIVSFYATAAGTTAQHVASSLGLPHVASFRGTDFELGIHRSGGSQRLRLVAENARQLLTTNREQARMLSAMFRVRRPVRTIHNALAGVAERPWWNPPEPRQVQLVADCGFSGRKATHLLLWAVENLVEKDMPVMLTVLGGIYHFEHKPYWERCRNEYKERYPENFHFPGRVSGEEVDRQLVTAHVYCSATLAEGCSISRIRALTTGIPIITTRCGAIPEVVERCGHVRLCAPGDWRELARGLEAMVGDILAGLVRPDRECVERWRRHFSTGRERQEWRDVISEVLDQEKLC